MTPLAQEIVRHGLAGQKRPWSELERSDCRCFEVSAVLELMRELTKNPDWSLEHERLAFLPAPFTWIEWVEMSAETGMPGRVGVLLTQITAGSQVDIEGGSHLVPNEGYLMRSCVWPHNEAPYRVAGLDPVAMYRDDGGHLIFAAPRGFDETERKFRLGVWMMRLAAAGMALINTPHIVGRRTHLPHAGLQREMARRRKMVGKFPLQAWTEITLNLTPPKEAQDDGHEAHLTGGRALHFCRAHLRVRLGKLEYVRHHWRGDPSIGIKQSRYVVKPPRLSRDLAVA